MTRIIKIKKFYPAYEDVDLNFFDFCSMGSSPSVSSSLDVSDFISLWKSPFLRFDCCCSNCLTKKIKKFALKNELRMIPDEPVDLLCCSRILFCRFKSSMSCWWEKFLRLINWIKSAAFLSICARLAAFSPCKDGTDSLSEVKLSFMWSRRFLSSALWWARFSAYNLKKL